MERTVTESFFCFVIKGVGYVYGNYFLSFYHKYVIIAL